jgi:acyl carrier protein phosphodiesterase
LHWSKYSSVPLADYTQKVYGIVDKHMDILPEEVNHFFPYMKRNDWLFNYANMEGLQRVFNGMSRRASFVSLMEEAPAELQMNYALYENEFFIFFEDLKKMCEEWIKEN